MLARYLFPDSEADRQEQGCLESNPAIWQSAYASESDTLRLQTGELPYTGYTEKTVAPGLCVNFDPEGWAMGVVIERAAELLRPLPAGGERQRCLTLPGPASPGRPGPGSRFRR